MNDNQAKDSLTGLANTIFATNFRGTTNFREGSSDTMRLWFYRIWLAALGCARAGLAGADWRFPGLSGKSVVGTKKRRKSTDCSRW